MVYFFITVNVVETGIGIKQVEIKVNFTYLNIR